MMARRTRHCLSSASWTMAGRRDWERRSMPITATELDPITHNAPLDEMPTFVHLFKLRNDVQANVREVILQHRQEHGEKVSNGPGEGLASLSIRNTWSSNSLILSKDRGKTTDLSTEGSPNVLRLIRDQIFHASHNLIKQGITIDQVAEAWIYCQSWVCTRPEDGKTYQGFDPQWRCGPPPQYPSRA